MKYIDTEKQKAINEILKMMKKDRPSIQGDPEHDEMIDICIETLEEHSSNYNWISTVNLAIQAAKYTVCRIDEYSSTNINKLKYWLMDLLQIIDFANSRRICYKGKVEVMKKERQS